jgi:hypothetical protein
VPIPRVGVVAAGLNNVDHRSIVVGFESSVAIQLEFGRPFRVEGVPVDNLHAVVSRIAQRTPAAASRAIENQSLASEDCHDPGWWPMRTTQISHKPTLLPTPNSMHGGQRWSRIIAVTGIEIGA